MLIIRRDAFALVAGFWNRGVCSLPPLFLWSKPSLGTRGWGAELLPLVAEKPLSNCKPTPAPSESAGEIAVSAADVSIIANNHNTNRAEAGRGASAFMQIDEHEAGSGRARSGTASRRRFALFCPLLQFLSYCKNTSDPCISLLS